MSTNAPPLEWRNCGGSREPSHCVHTTWSTSPYSPVAIRSRSRTTSRTNRCQYATWKATPATAAARPVVSTCAEVNPAGFSQSTGRPTAIASPTTSACRSVGAATMKAVGARILQQVHERGMHPEALAPQGRPRGRERLDDVRQAHRRRALEGAKVRASHPPGTDDGQAHRLRHGDQDGTGRPLSASALRASQASSRPSMSRDPVGDRTGEPMTPLPCFCELLASAAELA